ncbi:thioredoxin family protein [Butyricimonas paravirosa]|uniref:thioredoxin family protein n=1 Tax=Butyricimonas paravirosa TaxID=1472417 RepID=UPI0021092369|nr:thioredoxin family protein [Butyricimonas paravirosa]MCQ4872311.1 thioredoxin family protein [Butyricimonas paravirosa]
MRKIILMTFFLILGIKVFSQGGVNFENLTFDEALLRANTENKLVFIDCYTSWCGPCAQMMRVIFPQEKVGEFFTSRFVSLKVDMEKGEGPELKERFGVKAYPTFLIIRPDGSLQHRTTSANEDADAFIASIARGLNLKTSYEYLSQTYETGKISKKDLINYQIALNDSYEREKSEKIAKELYPRLKTKDMLQKDFWQIIKESDYGSDYFRFLVNHVDAGRKKFGKAEVDAYLYYKFNRAIHYSQLYNRENPLLVLKQVQADISKVELENRAELLLRLEVVKATLESDVNKLVSIGVQLGEGQETIAGLIMNAFDEIWAKTSRVKSEDVKNSYWHVVRARAPKEELKRVLTLEDKFLSIYPGIHTKNFFEDVKSVASTGVYFQDLSYKEALKKAKAQKCKLFIDCYTSWCGPCKKMAEEVFKQENVGNYLNENFICLKYDMEKGEGPELEKKFGVYAYPTFVIVNPDETICHKITGYEEATRFIELVSEAFDDGKALGALEKRFNEGDRDKAFLLQYAKAQYGVRYRDIKTITDELLKVSDVDDLLSEDYAFILYSGDLRPKNFDLKKTLLSDREHFNQTLGREKVDQYLGAGLSSDISLVLAGGGEKISKQRLEAIGCEIKSLKLMQEKQLLAMLAIAKSVKTGNIDRILASCEKEFPKIEDKKATVCRYLAKVLTHATDLQKSRWKKLKN